FVDCEWTSLVLSTLKLSTQRGYRMVLRKHVLPCFGQRRLCDITKMDIQQFVADKFRQGRAWQTVRNAWIVLSSVLDAAVDYGYLNSNPARGVKRSEERRVGKECRSRRWTCGETDKREQ